MFKITNISRDQHICGLYSGKSKKISSISEQMRELQKHQLLHIVELSVDEEIKDKKAPKAKEEISPTIVEETLEIIDGNKEVSTNGRS